MYTRHAKTTSGETTGLGPWVVLLYRTDFIGKNAQGKRSSEVDDLIHNLSERRIIEPRSCLYVDSDKSGISYASLIQNEPLG